MSEYFVYKIKNIYVNKIDPRITSKYHFIVALSPGNALNIADKYNLSYNNRKVKYRKIVGRYTIREAEHLNSNIKIWFEQNGVLKKVRQFAIF